MNAASQMTLFDTDLSPGPECDIAYSNSPAASDVISDIAYSDPAAPMTCSSPEVSSSITDIGYSEAPLVSDAVVAPLEPVVENVAAVAAVPTPALASPSSQRQAITPLRTWCTKVLAECLEYKERFKAVSADPARLDRALEALAAVALAKRVAYGAARGAQAPTAYVGISESLDFGWTVRQPVLATHLGILAALLARVDSIPMLPNEFEVPPSAKSVAELAVA